MVLNTEEWVTLGVTGVTEGTPDPEPGHPLQWAEGKYFTTAGESASLYVRQVVNSFGDRPYTVAQPNIPNSVLKGMSPVNVDSGIPAYVISNESLPNLTPNIMNYSPISGVQ
jgi:hypothetical protein